MKHITLREMLEEMVECILNNKLFPNYYWKDSDNQYNRIITVDLMYRIITENGDFTEFEWELIDSDLYREE